jgi:metallo-beta-lactamase family protein
MSVKLQFLGAARRVTGSSTLLTSDTARILIDCGLDQSQAVRRDQLFAFDPAAIDAVILTHGHLDHCGLIPALFEKGFSGKIIAHYATGELAAIVWEDTLKLSEHDSQPLYGPRALQAAIAALEYLDYEQEHTVAGVTLRLYDAGHILGSSHVALEADGKAVLFSGDIGVQNTPILKDPFTDWHQPFDAVVIESTYGNRTHKGREETIEEFGEILKTTIKNRGVLLIPAFAIGRTQEMLYHLNTLVEAGVVPTVPVLIDSPMANRVTRLYRSYTVCYDDETCRQIESGDLPLEFPGLHPVATGRESQAIREMWPPFVVVAGSGMCSGGRIVTHLKNFIGSPATTVMLVGWQGLSTLGRQLADGMESVVIDGDGYTVKAKIATLGGFSAHADQPALLAWAGAIPRRNTRWFVNHGEEAAATGLAKALQNEGFGTAVAVKQGQLTTL